MRNQPPCAPNSRAQTIKAVGAFVHVQSETSVESGPGKKRIVETGQNAHPGCWRARTGCRGRCAQRAALRSSPAGARGGSAPHRIHKQVGQRNTRSAGGHQWTGANRQAAGSEQHRRAKAARHASARQLTSSDRRERPTSMRSDAVKSGLPVAVVVLGVTGVYSIPTLQSARKNQGETPPATRQQPRKGCRCSSGGESARTCNRAAAAAAASQPAQSLPAPCDRGRAPACCRHPETKHAAATCQR